MKHLSLTNLGVLPCIGQPRWETMKPLNYSFKWIRSLMFETIYLIAHFTLLLQEDTNKLLRYSWKQGQTLICQVEIENYRFTLLLGSAVRVWSRYCLLIMQMQTVNYLTKQP